MTGPAGVSIWDTTGTATHCNDYTQGTEGAASGRILGVDRVLTSGLLGSSGFGGNSLNLQPKTEDEGSELVPSPL